MRVYLPSRDVNRAESSGPARKMFCSARPCLAQNQCITKFLQLFKNINVSYTRP